MKDTHGGNIWEASKDSHIKIQDLVDFSASINPLGLSKRAASALKRNLFLVPPYPDPESKELISALEVFYSIPKNEILPANGSTELIYLIPRVFKPKKALIIEPAF